MSRHNKNNSSGFTLVEVLISVGILAIVTGGIAMSLSQLYKQQQNVVRADEGNAFTSALFQHLLVQGNCNAATAALSIAGGARRQLTINTFTGMNITGPLREGTKVENGLFIKELSIQEKTGITKEPILIGTAQKGRSVAQVIVQLQRQLGDGQPLDLPPRIMEIPVVTETPSSNRIEGCYLDGDLEDMCLSTGGTLDPATNECIPPGQCTMHGTFVTTTCENTVEGEPCDPEYNGPDRLNAITNSASCPPGSCPTQSGKFKITRSIQTGKKSSKEITVIENFFICMSCQGVTCPAAPPPPAPAKKS